MSETCASIGTGTIGSRSRQTFFLVLDFCDTRWAPSRPARRKHVVSPGWRAGEGVVVVVAEWRPGGLGCICASRAETKTGCTESSMVLYRGCGPAHDGGQFPSLRPDTVLIAAIITMPLRNETQTDGTGESTVFRDHDVLGPPVPASLAIPRTRDKKRKKLK